MSPWENIQQVVILGLGVTGFSVVRHLQKYHPHLSLKVMDTRAQPVGQAQLPSNVALHCGSFRLDWLLAADLIVVNPGIALATPEIQQALAQGIPVVGDIELFAWQVTKPVIAITGSNGKSTVTDLAGVLANAAGVKTVVGGNIGVAALDLLEEDADLYVLELSSFQLETTSNLALVAAAFLNLSEDHMDRYQGQLELYRQAKLRIFKQAQWAIVNADDPQTWPPITDNSPSLLRFSAQHEADFCLAEHNGSLWLQVKGEPLLAVAELALVGQHNQSNVLAVLALLTVAGVNLDSPNVQLALKNYRGLAHRCQLVVENKGVRWVNDSKATNVASTLAALSGLQLAGRLYLLVGGQGKGADFSALKPALAQLDVQLCCFGQDADQLMALSSTAWRFEQMSEAIAHIAKQLKAGDMVLLSPACASLDQFPNFMVRGETFIQLAQRYA